MSDPFKAIIDLLKQREPEIIIEKDWADFRLAAISLHGNQKYAGVPYSFHLAYVENLLVETGFDGYAYKAAAWLHDAVEDTTATYQNIYDRFGGEVCSYVYACTGEGENRKQRNESIYKKLKQVPLAAPVKVADRIANMLTGLGNKSIAGVEGYTEDGNTDKLSMYVKEFPKFKEEIQPLVMDSPNGRFLWEMLEKTVDTSKERLGIKNEVSDDNGRKQQ